MQNIYRVAYVQLKTPFSMTLGCLNFVIQDVSDNVNKMLLICSTTPVFWTERKTLFFNSTYIESSASMEYLGYMLGCIHQS